VQKPKRLPQYEHRERTFRVQKDSRPEGALVKAHKWLLSQTSKLTFPF
jgi:hypothetical protein